MVRFTILSIALFFGFQSYAADCGRFAVVKQPVKYKKQGKSKFKKARKNAKVCQGDTIVTEKNGRAKIVMADNNEINISPQSELVIESYSNKQKVVLNVINGKVRSDVKNKYRDSKSSHYRVKTKSAVAGVRGTEFLTSYNAQTNQARVVTFEGQVAVGRMEGGNFVAKVVVKPGQFTTSTPQSEPHAAKEVPPAELAQMDQESKVSEPSAGTKAPASTDSSANEDDKEDSQEEPQDKKEPQSEKEKQKNKEPKDKKAQNSPNKDNNQQEPNDKGDRSANHNNNDGGNKPAAGEGRANGNGSGTSNGRGIASVQPDAPGGDAGGERGIAQIDLDQALPEPNLDIDGGTAGPDFNVPTTPLSPNDLLLIDPAQDICGTQCADAVINQKVKVIIVPRLPGQ